MLNMMKWFIKKKPGSTKYDIVRHLNEIDVRNMELCSIYMGHSYMSFRLNTGDKRSIRLDMNGVTHINIAPNMEGCRYALTDANSGIYVEPYCENYRLVIHSQGNAYFIDASGIFLEEDDEFHNKLSELEFWPNDLNPDDLWK